jgi:hypothetical protein
MLQGGGRLTARCVHRCASFTFELVNGRSSRSKKVVCTFEGCLYVCRWRGTAEMRSRESAPPACTECRPAGCPWLPVHRPARPAISRTATAARDGSWVACGLAELVRRCGAACGPMPVRHGPAHAWPWGVGRVVRCGVYRWAWGGGGRGGHYETTKRTDQVEIMCALRHASMDNAQIRYAVMYAVLPWVLPTSFGLWRGILTNSST